VTLFADEAVSSSGNCVVFDCEAIIVSAIGLSTDIILTLIIS
jgi:hypothetical protein